jgi:hypothetical protein
VWRFSKGDAVTDDVAEIGRSGDGDDDAETRLSPREMAFADALASGATTADAAIVAGISVRSARRWKIRPHVQVAIRARVNESLSQARAVLASGATRAAAALVGMADGTVRATSPRVQAARSVVESAVQLTDLQDLRDQMAALESRIDEEEESPCN